MKVLDLEDVAKSFPKGFWGQKQTVLSGLSMVLEPGEVFGFLGHNGAGKTTTMRLILGLMKPDAGRITVFGSAGADRRARSRIGYLGEHVGLHPHMDAEEMLWFTGELFRLSPGVIRSRRDELLETVGLRSHARQKIAGYSKGMRQRLGLAVALMNDPELLLLDEPYTGLDPIGRRELRQILLSLKGHGKTVFLSSHIVPDVEAVCDRVGILNAGRIQRCLDLKQIYAQKTSRVEVTVSGVDTAAISSIGRRVSVVYANNEATVARCEGPGTLKTVISKVYELGGNVLEVKPLRFSLEDYLVDTMSDRSPAADVSLVTAGSEVDYARSH